MKKNVFIALMSIILFSCSFGRNEQVQKKSIKQDLSYTDSSFYFSNPDQGFYNAVTITVGTNGISNLKDIKEDFKDSDFDLIHLKMDISAFSKNVNKSNDLEITAAAKSSINSVLKYLKDEGKTTIIRFAYDKEYDGNGGENKAIEPDKSMIKKHLEAIGPILSENKSVITAIEMGLFGPWGEMHSTPYGEDYNLIAEIMDKYLSCTKGSGIPLLVRKPAFIYTYLKNYLGAAYNKKSVPSYTVMKNSEAYRLGLYNDGYLGDADDLGTYQINRAKEVNYLGQFTDHTPYGGEVCTYIDDDTGKEDLSIAIWDNLSEVIPNMYKEHLSFLNIDWNDTVIARWKTSSYKYNGETAFNYIQKHMGYRFVLKDCTFSYPEDMSSLTASMKIENVGFGNMPCHRQKVMRIIFENASTNKQAFTVQLDSTFTGQTYYSGTASISSLPSGTYNVYAKICDTDGNYPIRLANNLWNSSYKANKIGSFTK